MIQARGRWPGPVFRNDPSVDLLETTMPGWSPTIKEIMMVEDRFDELAGGEQKGPDSFGGEEEGPDTLGGEEEGPDTLGEAEH
jgi:hypothetical protein